MAKTLAESFLADLDELSDDEPVAEEDEPGQDDRMDDDGLGVRAGGSRMHALLHGCTGSAACRGLVQGRMHSAATPPHPCMHAHTQLDDIEALNYDNLEAVAKLSSSTRYKDVMKARAGSRILSQRGQMRPPCMQERSTPAS
jgi:hypothetical protein